MSTKHEQWVPVLDESDVAPGALATVKHGAHQLVVGRSASDGLFALAGRCPHEGYPLAQGDLKGGELTCCWHNWKFRVSDGACLLGGEGVRAYPVRVRDGRIEADLAEPDPEVTFPALLAGLSEGMRQRDNGRALRDAARLLKGGYPPARLAADVAAHDARHAEYGTTHVLPVAADCARLLGRYRGTDALYALAPAIDLCGETNVRLPERPLAPPIARDPSAADATGEELRRATLAEDGALAEGLLLGAFDAGVPRRVIEGWLYAVLTDHFLDFGHPLIYLVKSQELLDAAGPAGAAHARAIHAAQLHGIVLGTREDTLPYWRGFRERLQALEPELPALWRNATGRAPVDAAALRDAVLDGKPREAFEAVLAPLGAGAAPGEVARALVGAAAHRLLRFDDRLDRDPTVAETWLWATHRFTHAAAVRHALERFAAPDALRLLFHAAAFVNTGKGMDLAPDEREEAPVEAAGEATGEATVDDVVLAIASRDAGRAVRLTRGLLRSGAPVDGLRARLEDLCLADPLVRPIVVAHAIKTTVAAFEEHAALAGSPDREIPLLALARLLASPIVERRVHQTARASLRWVVHGEMPRKLTQ